MCGKFEKNPLPGSLARERNLFYAPTHDVAPSAVTMAVATDAMICTINLMVSFLLIMFNV